MDYRVSVKVRNNNLLREIEKAGYVPGSKFADIVGIRYDILNDLIKMKRKAVDKNGDITPPVEKLCIFLHKMPNELFSDAQMYFELKSNQSEFEADEQFIEMMALNNDGFSKMLSLERERDCENALLTLPERTANIIRQRFGFESDEKTMREVALSEKVGKERIRQIEAKGLRMLRHPTRSTKLKQHLAKDQ